MNPALVTRPTKDIGMTLGSWRPREKVEVDFQNFTTWTQKLHNLSSLEERTVFGQLVYTIIRALRAILTKPLRLDLYVFSQR